MTRIAKVLLINSDPDDYIIARDLLNEARGITYEVHWEPSCQGALREVALVSYDACLVDFALGRFAGLELIRELRLGNPELPIIMLAARVDDHLMDAVVEAGAAGYLIKGEVTSESLDRAIRRRLRTTQQSGRSPKNVPSPLTVTLSSPEWLYRRGHHVFEKMV